MTADALVEQLGRVVVSREQVQVAGGTRESNNWRVGIAGGWVAYMWML